MSSMPQEQPAPPPRRILRGPAGTFRAPDVAVVGLVSGLVFALAEIAAGGARGEPFLEPLRRFASIALGERALAETPLATAVIVGTLVHAVISVAYGALYELFVSALAPTERPRLGASALLGLVYGTVVWFMNFEVVARLAYPWMLEAPRLIEWALHAVFYGLPLALLFAVAEPRMRRHAREVEPGPRAAAPGAA